MILAILMLLAFQSPMLENDYVMVHMGVDQPHKKGPEHSHARDRVMIYLDDGAQQIVRKSGTIENLTWKAGQVAWSPATGSHTSENVGQNVLYIIEIDLKPNAPASKPFAISPLDPVNVDPKHYHLEFENDKVRVFRGRYLPYEEGVMHEHLNDRVVAYLKGGEIRVTTPDGKSEINKRTDNTVSWGGPTKHRESIGASPIEMIVVELKN